MHSKYRQLGANLNDPWIRVIRARSGGTTVSVFFWKDQLNSCPKVSKSGKLLASGLLQKRTRLIRGHLGLPSGVHAI